jgi:hypothetical protein
MRGRELLKGWWWAVDPKFVFDQMEISVPEIMDTTSYDDVVVVVVVKK